MLSEFLKEIKGSNIKWGSSTPGIEWCQFCISTKTEKIVSSFFNTLSSCNVELLFCFKGELVARNTKGRIFTCQQQEVLLFADSFSMRGIEIDKEIEGILISIDISKAKESFSVISNIMGNWNLNIDTIMQYIDEMSLECEILHYMPWTLSVFSALEKLADDEQSCFCIWKTIELLYMLSTRTIQFKNLNDSFINDRVSRRLNDICTYMELHLDEKITIEKLSHRFYLSSTSLKKHFLRVYGQSVHKWLLKKRMEKAAELLQFSSMTILQIAQSVGYTGLSQFNVTFKKYFKSTPGQYRNMSNSVKFSPIQQDNNI